VSQLLFLRVMSTAAVAATVEQVHAARL